MTSVLLGYNFVVLNSYLVWFGFVGFVLCGVFRLFLAYMFPISSYFISVMHNFGWSQTYELCLV